MNKKILAIIFFIIFLILCRFIYNQIDLSNKKYKKTHKSTPIVTVYNVSTRKLHRQFTANARVHAKYRVNILARINGYLNKSYFKEGDYVKAGQILFEIEPQEYLYAANKAKANLDNVMSQATYYQKQLYRYSELVSKDYIAKSDYDNMLAQSSAFNAQVESAKSAYNDAKRNLSYTKIKAPVDGRVGVIAVTVGNYVTTNSGALTTINSSDPMYISFALDVKDYADLTRIDKSANVNRDVEFTFSTGEKYEYKGIQDFHDNAIDETTGTIMLRATFPNKNDRLIQGDFGKVTIYSKTEDEICVVPQSAVMENQAGKYVFVLDSNNLPQLTYIKVISETNDGFWLISDGIKTGDTIIKSGLQKVIQGKPVKIVENDTVDNVKKDNLFVKIFKKIKNMIIK